MNLLQRVLTGSIFVIGSVFATDDAPSLQGSGRSSAITSVVVDPRLEYDLDCAEQARAWRIKPPLFREPYDCPFTYRGNPFDLVGLRETLSWGPSNDLRLTRKSVFPWGMFESALRAGIYIFDTGKRPIGYFKLQPATGEDLETVHFILERLFPNPHMEKLFLRWMTLLLNRQHGQRIRIPGGCDAPEGSYTFGRIYTRPPTLEGVKHDTACGLVLDGIEMGISLGRPYVVTQLRLPLWDDPRSQVSIHSDECSWGIRVP